MNSSKTVLILTPVLITHLMEDRQDQWVTVPKSGTGTGQRISLLCAREGVGSEGDGRVGTVNLLFNA